MPYIRLASLPLSDETKRRLADELTATVLDILPDQKPEWTTVHFTAYAPDDMAVAGRLVSDGAPPDMHIEISAPDAVDEKAWIALRNRLTDVLVEELGISETAARWHVNVKLNRFDPHSFAIGGDAADELAVRPMPRRRGRARPVLLLGFALGALASYRWLMARLATDTVVDVAPPPEKYEEPAPAGTSSS